ncbi:MAG: asparagine synthase (glutamine-hydrolyzing), partial [Acidimicrobiales bacterium]|nr:asparagine synthase (glutamine-hydrolyzing) [Acidimicrobiales bacterium]
VGHCRLSINDLSELGSQPMTSPSGRYLMVFNGEIYNSPELRRECEAFGSVFRSQMDGEVILHLWELEGSDCLKKLNGIFAISIVDTIAKSVTIARDPVGVKPLFYSYIDNRFGFASEIAALNALGINNGGLDPTGLAQFLTFLWIPAPNTPFKNIKALRPGEMAVYTNSGFVSKRFSPVFTATSSTISGTPSDLVAEVSAKIRQAANRQLLSDVPIGIMASGGVDSGLIWAHTSKYLSLAYSISWDLIQKDSEGISDDLASARLVASKFQTKLREISGDDWDESRLPPSADLFADPAYELVRKMAIAAREDGLKVLFSGQGGDEVFGGYRRHAVARFIGSKPHFSSLFFKGLYNLFKMKPGMNISKEYISRLVLALSEGDREKGYLQLCSYSTQKDRANALGLTTAEVSDDVVYKEHLEVFAVQPPNISFLRKAMSVDLNVYLPGLGLSYVDRASMEAGIEVRVPLVDLELLKYSLALPDSVLIRRGTTKWIAKQAALAVLPPETVERPKRSFGAPASQVGSNTNNDNSRGYRQSRYFSHACQVLEKYTEKFA